MAPLFVRAINSSLYGRSDFMNFDLNYDGFEEYFVGKHPKNEGIQYKFKFPNGYGVTPYLLHFSVTLASFSIRRAQFSSLLGR